MALARRGGAWREAILIWRSMRWLHDGGAPTPRAPAPGGRRPDPSPIPCSVPKHFDVDVTRVYAVSGVAATARFGRSSPTFPALNSPTRHVFAHGGLTLASAPARTLAASQPAASGCTANELASSESSAHGLRSRSNTLQYGGLQRESGVVTVAGMHKVPKVPPTPAPGADVARTRRAWAHPPA